ncbi:hypothetical protein ABKN59_004073 [Abortiporus biennis]
MDVFTVKRMMDAIDVARWSNLSELYVISPLHYPLPQLHRLLSILGSKLRKFGFLEPKDPIKLANAVADVTAMRHCVALQSFTWRTITDENLIELLRELPNPFKLRQLIFAFPTLFLGTITPGYITVLDKFLTEEFTGLRLIEIRYEGLLSYSEAEKRVHGYFPKSTARGIMKVTRMLTKWTSSEDLAPSLEGRRCLAQFFNSSAPPSKSCMNETVIFISPRSQSKYHLYESDLLICKT